MSNKKNSHRKDSYLHGFTKEEQNRLYSQARIHEDIIFSQVDFGHPKKLLEVGSGVGAQTQILIERYPDSQISCVDASKSQLDRARKTLSSYVKAKKIQLYKADASQMPFEDNFFDGAFICWLLEHVQDPLSILKETRRCLKSGGVIFCNEVFNSTFYIHPYSPYTLKFWFEFNDYQWELKGDPFVGGKLANYLIKAGFQNVKTKVLTHQYDDRTPKKRALFIEYWCHLLLSAAPGLLKAGRVDKDIIEGMKSELEALKNTSDSVIFYSWILASGIAL